MSSINNNVVVLRDEDGDKASITNGQVHVNVKNIVPSGCTSGINDDIDTSPEQLIATNSCIRIDMQADYANTGDVFIGDATVANDGTGGGIRLEPGDFYSVEIVATSRIYAVATVANQKVMWSYFTE